MSVPEHAASRGAGAPGEGRAPRLTRAGWGWLLGVAAVGLLLRLHDLTAGDVWVDEANSIWTARESVGALLERLRSDSSPPAYYLLLRAWAALFGDSPAALRGLSVAIGTLAIVAVGRLGRRWVSERGALLAAWLFATSPLQIYHAQQIRMYALLALLSLASLYALARTLDTGGRRAAAAWTITTLLALYTHNFAFHLLPLQALWIVLSGQALTRWRLWAGVAGVGLCAYLPWLPTLLEQLANGDHYAWYEPLWEAKGVLGTAYQMLLAFSPTGELVAKWTPDELPWWFGLPALALAACALGGAVALARRGEGFARHALASALLVPTLTALGLSSFLTPHFVPARVDQLMAPAFALLAGAGLARLPGRVPVALAAALLLAGSLIAKPHLYPDFERYGLAGSDRRASQALAEGLRPGDALLCTSLTRASLAYYLSLADVSVPIVSFPRDTAQHLGSQNDARWLADRARLVAELDASLAAAVQALGPGGRLWVARVPAPVNLGLAPPALATRGFALLDRRGPYQQTDTGQRIRIEVYEPPGSAPGRRSSRSMPKKVPGASGGSP